MTDEGRAPPELLSFRSSLLLQKNKRERADTEADSQADVGSNSSVAVVCSTARKGTPWQRPYI